MRKLLALTMLGPRALKAALTGTLPGRVGLDELLRAARRPDWSEQAAYLGIA